MTWSTIGRLSFLKHTDFKTAKLSDFQLFEKSDDPESRCPQTKYIFLIKNGTIKIQQNHPPTPSYVTTCRGRHLRTIPLPASNFYRLTYTAIPCSISVGLHLITTTLYFKSSGQKKRPPLPTSTHYVVPPIGGAL